MNAMHTPCCSGVYFIQDGLGRIKIGVTRDISRRLSDLKTGSSTSLLLVRFVEGAGPKVERWFHRRFNGHRIQGEWFHFTPEMMTVVAPDEVNTKRSVTIVRRDVRLTVRERIKQADENADLIGLTQKQRLMTLIQEVDEDEAEELCGVIRDFANHKPRVLS